MDRKQFSWYNGGVYYTRSLQMFQNVKNAIFHTKFVKTAPFAYAKFENELFPDYGPRAGRMLVLNTDTK